MQCSLLYLIIWRFCETDGCPPLQMAGVMTSAVTNIVLDYVFVMKLLWSRRSGDCHRYCPGCVYDTVRPVLWVPLQAPALWQIQMEFEALQENHSAGNVGQHYRDVGGLVIFLFNHMILSIIGIRELSATP